MATWLVYFVDRRIYDSMPASDIKSMNGHAYIINKVEITTGPLGGCWTVMRIKVGKEVQWL